VPERPFYVLGIESSCDETAAAVTSGQTVLSNIIATQRVHEQYGGIVPELASRAHQMNIIPVVDMAIRDSGIRREEIRAVAFTAGPGLIGSLMVGSSFAKAFALALDLPVVGVNHMQAHVLAHFARKKDDPGHRKPALPFLCLTVSGGHTQLVRVDGMDDMKVIGQTLDDAAGEAFDKIAKILGLPYPGGPVLDRQAREGDPGAFRFPLPRMDGYDYSFSGLKTAVLYFLRDAVRDDAGFVEKNLASLCASVQHTIVTILMEKLTVAASETGISEVALSGGVSANSGLRRALEDAGRQHGWNTYVPPPAFCTDNAAMIAVAGYHRLLAGAPSAQGDAPFARFTGF